MNQPPERYITVPAATLRPFVAALFRAVALPDDHAAFLADLLVTNDLRGVFSHGTRQVSAYIDHFRTGRLNPVPHVRRPSDSGATAVFDGDGGLGYFPAHAAALWATERAKESGIAAALTRDHGHFGAAGIYARIALAHDLFAYVTSGHQLHLQPGQPLLTAGGGSPMAFALPTHEEPPFVLDFGVMHDLYPGSEHVDAMVRLAPGVALRALGLGAVCQSLGGFLAGIPVDPARASRNWSGANQGSLIIALDLARFGSLDAFKAEMDAYARAVRTLTPLPGFSQAALAGTPEWEREREYAQHGIPIAPEHAEALRAVAESLGIVAPF
jgi:LDH2 family malate/lactate/ureidoglycolate dehydrogenase